MAAKVLLSFHVRVLLQSLRGGGGSVSHALQVALPGLARICDFVLRDGLDIEYLHGRIRKPSPGYPSRKGGDQIEGFRRSIKVGAAESGWRCLMLPVVDGGGFRVRVGDQSGPFHGPEPG